MAISTERVTNPRAYALMSRTVRVRAVARSVEAAILGRPNGVGPVESSIRATSLSTAIGGASCGSDRRVARRVLATTGAPESHPILPRGRVTAASPGPARLHIPTVATVRALHSAAVAYGRCLERVSAPVLSVRHDTHLATSGRREGDMGGRYAAQLTQAAEHQAEATAGFVRLAAADGVWTPEERAVLASMQRAGGAIERADNGRLDVISMLDHGELRTRRIRRRRDLARDLGPDTAA